MDVAQLRLVERVHRRLRKPGTLGANHRLAHDAHAMPGGTASDSADNRLVPTATTCSLTPCAQVLRWCIDSMVVVIGHCAAAALARTNATRASTVMGRRGTSPTVHQRTRRHRALANSRRP